jgi:hypothetical protein
MLAFLYHLFEMPMDRDGRRDSRHSRGESSHFNKGAEFRMLNKKKW